MVKVDPEERERLKAREKEWKMWKYLQAVIEFKQHKIKSNEAAERMAFWSGLDSSICFLMLQGMKHESVVQLSKARPKVDELPSVFPDKL
jgi:hypothetical protein